MSREILSPQELFCHLTDYNLTNPLQDEWNTFCCAIRVWLDCWFNSEPIRFAIVDNQLSVFVNEKRTIMLTYDNSGRFEYPLHIVTHDGDEFQDDHYKINLRSLQTA